jgi:hypothetical protein
MSEHDPAFSRGVAQGAPPGWRVGASGRQWDHLTADEQARVWQAYAAVLAERTNRREAEAPITEAPEPPKPSPVQGV